MRTATKISSFLVALAAAVFLFKNIEPRNMSEIKIDLGLNINEIEKIFGAQTYNTRNVAGLVSYSIENLPNDLAVMFIRPGFETSFAPIFALTLYADQENQNDLAVTEATLQFSTDSVRDHRSGQSFVSLANSKFAAKKWTRHIPELCPAVDGRSSFLQPDETVAVFEACPIDPTYQIQADEWRRLATRGLSYEWIGDGVIATVNVNSNETLEALLMKCRLTLKTRTLDQNIAPNAWKKNCPMAIRMAGIRP